MYNCAPLQPSFFLLPPPLPAEAMSCGLINSALMGAQQEGGGGGGPGSQVCGMLCSATALSPRDKPFLRERGLTWGWRQWTLCSDNGRPACRLEREKTQLMTRERNKYAQEFILRAFYSLQTRSNLALSPRCTESPILWLRLSFWSGLLSRACLQMKNKRVTMDVRH